MTLGTKGFGLDIGKLFEPRSIAVIGASEREGSPGAAVLRNLLSARFKGRVYPVNPKHEKVQRRRCYSSIRSIGKEIDLAVIVTPARAVPDVLEECGECGVDAAIVISAGFREIGEAGQALERSVVRVARRHGIRFLGPNCLGVMRPDIGLNATFSHCMANKGRIALVSQSGALCTAILDWARPRGIGFSCVISSGIAADVDFGEILDYLVLDARTGAIMLYVEGLHDARRFMSALRAASRAKPVVVMKAGRHTQGGKAAASHTGALVGSDEVFETAIRRAGVVRARRYDQFFAAAATLHAGVRTAGPRLAIVTNGGGPGVIAADRLADVRLDLATLAKETRQRLDKHLPAAWSGNNPIDVLGDATPDRYASALETCLSDPGVDAALAILVPQSISDPEAVAARVADISDREAKPVFACWMGEKTMSSSRKLFLDRKVPTYSTPEAAVDAFAAAAAYHTNQQLLLQVPEPLSRQDHPSVDDARMIIEAALSEKREMLDAVESKAILAAFDIPILQSTPVREMTEAIALAQEIGFPVAMKIRSHDITHKTDVDGVRLGLNSGHDIRKAWREMHEAVAKARPDARIEGVMLERMWKPPAGRELMVGVLNDPVFGPVISVGLGGTMVEVIGDRSIALPPLNRYLVRRMIARTKAARYLECFRGKPAASMEALEDVILRVSEMVCELPAVTEMDINPLIVDERGAVAVDARIRVRHISTGAREYAHMAIHPYPSTLVQELEMADGLRWTIRPIRPEDAVMEREFVNGLSDRSRYLRFMYVLNEITPEMLSRFTQIDYDREMALIAVVHTEEGDHQVGVARYVTYPDGRGCEFAIVVGDDWQRKGIATRLLESLIDVARDRRLETMDGIVLRENRNMLALAERVGFRQERSREDPELMVLTLKL
ncbi:MAG: acetyl-CoA synthetase [Gammaproteobacteria bacterium SG8_31]|nr:MAG: acetyl-CoA synthetase [Gammaproteobacteria bacterium SG8_31]